MKNDLAKVLRALITVGSERKSFACQLGGPKAAASGRYELIAQA